MVSRYSNFRIARGCVVSKGKRIALWREGWWWTSDHIDRTGWPDSPEGPFTSKIAATRHLRGFLSGLGHENFNGWTRFERLGRPSTKPVSKHLLLTMKLERQERVYRDY